MTVRVISVDLWGTIFDFHAEMSASEVRRKLVRQYAAGIGFTDGEAVDMSFIFDGAWGHTKVKSVNNPLPAKAFDGTFYEWDYSRVYLKKPVKTNKLTKR